MARLTALGPHVYASSGVSVVARDGFLDITGAARVRLHISGDGSVIWVHTESGLNLRICQIRGEIEIEDRRDAQLVKRRRKQLIRPSRKVGR
jgi:hypothetical protein